MKNRKIRFLILVQILKLNKNLLDALYFQSDSHDLCMNKVCQQTKSRRYFSS